MIDRIKTYEHVMDPWHDMHPAGCENDGVRPLRRGRAEIGACFRLALTGYALLMEVAV